MIHSTILLAIAASAFSAVPGSPAFPNEDAFATNPKKGQVIINHHRHARLLHALTQRSLPQKPLQRALPLRNIEAANRDAVREPDRDEYLGAVQIYPWSEGSLYRLYAAPLQISDIELEAGESLVSVAAGDTARWVIGDTSSGNGASRRTHILVKPTAPNLRTNIVIATDRRIYHVEAVSSLATAMAAISWSYPQDMLVARSTSVAIPFEPVAAPEVAVESLNFGYRILGDNSAWRPVRAFDDGHQTFIEFPPTLGDGEAPPLFATGADGKTELLNYRLKGRYYVVDQLFGAAELRLGGKHQQVVRIVRDSAARHMRRTA